MKEAMKMFVMDYLELYKNNWRFFRKHWKGVLLISVVFVGAEVAILEFDNVKYKIRRNNAEKDFEAIKEAVEKVDTQKIFEECKVR